MTENLLQTLLYTDLESSETSSRVNAKALHWGISFSNYRKEKEKILKEAREREKNAKPIEEKKVRIMFYFP